MRNWETEAARRYHEATKHSYESVRRDFRTYSSAGALYPVEVYVATADGLFHFHPRELGLRQLRDEDVRGALGGGETVLS
jgi:hypothetical protein